VDKSLASTRAGGAGQTLKTFTPARLARQAGQSVHLVHSKYVEKQEQEEI